METLPDKPPSFGDGLELDLLGTLERQEKAAPRERVTTQATWVLLAIFGLVGSFVLGAWTHREYGPKSTTTATSSTPAASQAAATGATATGGGFGQRGQGAQGGQAPTGSLPAGGFAGGGAGATIGTVKLIDGNNVYITDQSGDVVKVNVPSGVAVNVSKQGTVADLSVGETVVVTGDAGSDGTIAATSVRSGNAGVLGGRGAGGAGAASSSSTTTR